MRLLSACCAVLSLLLCVAQATAQQASATSDRLPAYDSFAGMLDIGNGAAIEPEVDLSGYWIGRASCRERV